MLIKKVNFNSKLIKLSEIKIPETFHKNLNQEDIDNLIESISKIGLISQIVIDQEYNLISGFNRIHALIQMKEEKVRVKILECSHTDPIARLTYIDENLIKKDITFLEKSLLLKERKELYEGLYPETKKGGTKTHNPRFETFTKSIAGRSQRALQEDIQIVSKLDPDIINDLEHLEISNKKSELKKLGQYPISDQKSIIKKMKDEKLSKIPDIVQIESVDRGSLKDSSTISAKVSENKIKEKHRPANEIKGIIYKLIEAVSTTTQDELLFLDEDLKTLLNFLNTTIERKNGEFYEE